MCLQMKLLTKPPGPGPDSGEGPGLGKCLLSSPLDCKPHSGRGFCFGEIAPNSSHSPDRPRGILEGPWPPTEGGPGRQRPAGFLSGSGKGRAAPVAALTAGPRSASPKGLSHPCLHSASRLAGRGPGWQSVGQGSSPSLPSSARRPWEWGEGRLGGQESGQLSICPEEAGRWRALSSQTSHTKHKFTHHWLGPLRAWSRVWQCGSHPAQNHPTRWQGWK